MVIKAVLVMTLVAGAACSYKSDFADCEVACTESTGCPSGFTCAVSEGLCRSGANAASCAAVLDGGVDGRVDAGVDDSIDAASAACPAVFNNTRHLFVNELKEWPAARAHCTSLDPSPTVAPYVHLVVVNDATEFGQLVPTGTPLDDDAWLGYTDSKLNPSGAPDRAKFLWITDEQVQPGFAMWKSDQPDDTSGPRGVSKRFSDGLMYDRTFTSLRVFFCECDEFPENPNNL